MWAFNFDMLMGYLFGGFTCWAFTNNRWKTMTAVGTVVLFGLAADIPQDFLP